MLNQIRAMQAEFSKSETKVASAVLSDPQFAGIGVASQALWVTVSVTENGGPAIGLLGEGVVGSRLTFVIKPQHFAEVTGQGLGLLTLTAFAHGHIKVRAIEQ